MHIPDTRRRVRRTADHSFGKGGMVMRVKFGYFKLTREQARAMCDHPDDLLIAKDPKMTHWIMKMKRLIVEQRKYGSEVTEWLNECNVPLPRYVNEQTGQWKWSHVRDLLRDDILWGRRRHRKTQYLPIMGTGKHRREKNSEPLEKCWPQLAHMTKLQFDQLQRAMDELAPDKKNTSGPNHPRYRVRRSDSITPLQHATCAICGSFMIPSGMNVIKCKKAWKNVPDQCWNHVQINKAFARKAIIETVLKRIDHHTTARTVMMDAAWAQIAKRHQGQNHELQQINAEINRLKREGDHIADAIAGGVQLAQIIEKAAGLENQLAAANKLRRDLTKTSNDNTLTSVTRESLQIDPQSVLLDLSRTSFAFSDLLRKVVPSFVIVPIQQLDCGLVRPRALITVDLSSFATEPPPPPPEDPATPDTSATSDTPEPEPIAVDLFEPPVHIRPVRDVMRIKAQNPSIGPAKIAKILGLHKMTAKRALDYVKRMEAEGLTSPYRVLTIVPRNASRWKHSLPADITRN